MLDLSNNFSNECNVTIHYREDEQPCYLLFIFRSKNFTNSICHLTESHFFIFLNQVEGSKPVTLEGRVSLYELVGFKYEEKHHQDENVEHVDFSIFVDFFVSLEMKNFLEQWQKYGGYIKHRKDRDRVAIFGVN